jgi:hypothetical protein
VIGFTGLGGREIFDPSTSTPIAESDILAFAKSAERALVADDEELQALRRRALAASARILDEYSVERQHTELIAFYGSLLARDVSPTQQASPGRPAACSAPSAASRTWRREGSS